MDHFPRIPHQQAGGGIECDDLTFVEVPRTNQSQHFVVMSAKRSSEQSTGIFSGIS